MNVFVPKTYRPKWKKVRLRKKPNPWQGSLSNSFERAYTTAGLMPPSLLDTFLPIEQWLEEIVQIPEQKKSIPLPLGASIKED